MSRTPMSRFDVFAIFNYVKNVSKGMEDGRAKGEAIWLAKVIAGGARRAKRPPMTTEQKQAAHLNKMESKKEDPVSPEGWKSLSGIPQTDKLYDHQIIEKLGEERYRNVVLPAIKAAFEAGRSYVAIRDEIRTELERKE